MSVRGAATTALRAACAAALVAGAWEVQRRRDLRAVQADPEWDELNRRIAGREQTVRAGDGTRLHVEIHGPDDAPSIVLVHGWTCDLTFWHHQVRDLARYFRIVMYDQRGHGRSDVPQDDDCYTADTLASDLQSVLDACVPDGQRALIVGHSMGGMTIVAWAGRHPDVVHNRLGGAVLVNTGMNELQARLLILGPLVGARVHQTLISPLMATRFSYSTRLEPVSFRIVRRLNVSSSASPGVVAFLHRMELGCPAPVRAGFGRLFSDLDLSGSVPSLAVPSMVIAGEEDRLLPPWHSRQLAGGLPSLVELAVLPGVAHMAPLEAPNEVTSRIRQLAAQTLTAPVAVPAG